MLDLLLDVTTLIETVGHLGLFLIVFAESGLFIGFFLPGDSLLFTAGFLASQGILHFPLLLIGSFVAAVVGDSVGYTFGAHVGNKIFSRPDSWLFKQEHLTRTKKFYERHGAKTIVLARFMPIVRTFAPILAGVGQMPYRTFFIYNVVGAALWALGIPSIGYWLGNAIPNIDHYLLPIILVIVGTSFIPPLWHVWQERRTAKKTLHTPDKNI